MSAWGTAWSNFWSNAWGAISGSSNSAWGNSWSSSWGSSWGSGSSTPPPPSVHHLAFISCPATARANELLSPQPLIGAYDIDNNIVESFNGHCSFSIVGAGLVLSATSTGVDFVSGIARPDNLAIEFTDSSTYGTSLVGTLLAVVLPLYPGVPETLSSPILIIGAPPVRHLHIEIEPGGSVPGVLSIQPKVSIFAGGVLFVGYTGNLTAFVVLGAGEVESGSIIPFVDGYAQYTVLNVSGHGLVRLAFQTPGAAGVIADVDLTFPPSTAKPRARKSR